MLFWYIIPALPPLIVLTALSIGVYQEYKESKKSYQEYIKSELAIEESKNQTID
jgi:hypothetical protein